MQIAFGLHVIRAVAECYLHYHVVFLLLSQFSNLHFSREISVACVGMYA